MPASPPSMPPAPLSLSQIEARFKSRIWRGNAWGASDDPVISSGFQELDKELPGGGWPTRNLMELLLSAEGLGEIRLLSRALGEITRSERNILLVAPPYIPYMHAWEHQGIDSHRVVLVRACKPAERLWALEQGIRSAAFGAIIGWLPEASQQATRKLQILSRTAAGLVFLFRPARAQFESSAAPLRILLNPVRGHSHTLSLYLLKRRGAPFVLPVRIPPPQAAIFSRPAELKPVLAPLTN
ncbi:MAG: translesion DNA synthesis-associated protein ImuA [Nitrosospira multiformis]|nr:translesion DNA synthesis-associated protein ImuA [Nitrosospira multiformis]